MTRSRRIGRNYLAALLWTLTLTGTLAEDSLSPRPTLDSILADLDKAQADAYAQ